MKKIHTTFLWCILCILLYAPSASGQSQFECAASIEITLDPNGTYTLFPEDILVAGNLAGYTPVLTPSTFTCSDVGLNTVLLQIYDGSALIFSCTTPVFVSEDTDPQALCVSDLHVELDGQGNHTFTFDELDNGSSDNCSTIQYQIIPESINCASDNPATVQLVITDASGNSASCTASVLWDPYPNPTQSLVCNGFVVVTVAFGDEVTITPDMILEGGPYGCPIQYQVVLSENMIPRPEPKVTIDDTGKIFLAVITDLNTGNSCWGELAVTSGNGCDPVFEICDTECRSTPIGDCASGHTDQDNVEWPCDIDMNMTCDYYNLNYVFPPSFLIEEGIATPEDASPVIIDSACYLTSTSYYDQVFFSFTEKWIIRTWSIIYWNTGEIWNYTQRINLVAHGLDICDTLPWNTPIGDCASGHTDTDDVEWPADITVSSLCIHPDDLAMNPDVAAENVRPNVFSNCNAVQMTYLDVATVINDSTVLVERTWQIHDFNTSVTWTYVQTITAHADPNVSVVCTMRENGEGIPGAELISGVITDADGCVNFDNPDGIIVTPIKDSPIEEGVSLMDKILLMEHILGISTLTRYQQYAADLSQDGFLSTIDVVMMDQILNGTFNPPFPHNWKFFERTTQLPSADISDPLHAYKFIGVKMGDIDNSYVLPFTTPIEEISLAIDDEILNKKEEYQIPFSLEQNIRIKGFSIQIKNNNANIHFLEVLAPSLPGFNTNDHVTISGDYIRINYIAPQAYLENGVSLSAGTPLFTLRLQPTQNAILSEEITLESNHDNLLRSSSNDMTFEFNFNWNNVIISSALNLQNGRTLEFYPNPVSDKIHFKGFTATERGIVSIADATGRIVAKEPLQESINLSRLEPGMYYISVSLDGGESFASPLLKIKP